MISVCHIITRMILGGAQENTLFTVKGLHEDDRYKVTLLTGPALGPEGELLEEARSFGIDTVVIDEMRRAINPLNDSIAAYKIYDHLTRNDYDIVHTHSSKAGVLGRWAGRLAGIPWIYHTIHGLPYHEYQSRVKNWTYKFIERATGSITHNIQTVCDRMAEKAREAGVYPINHYETVYSGMELEPFLDVPDIDSNEIRNHREEWGFDQEHFVFGKIARLFHLKGHKYCLRAFDGIVDRYPQARLFLVGDGILRDKLEGFARKRGIRDKIVFAGLVPYERIPEMISIMDCLVHTSLREGLARVIPQAQASGRPVISFDIDGAPEAINHGETGFLVEPESVPELIDSMEQIIRDEELREKMSQQGREWVQPQFHWEHMVDQIKKSYEQQLSIPA